MGVLSRLISTSLSKKKKKTVNLWQQSFQMDSVQLQQITISENYMQKKNRIQNLLYSQNVLNYSILLLILAY